MTTTSTIKAIINPGRSFAATAAIRAAEKIVASTEQIVSEWAQLGPALRAAAQREEAARAARGTIEEICEGPGRGEWRYKAAPGTPRSLLRTGWHAIGEPCPRQVSDAIRGELLAARVAYQDIAAPLGQAARAAGVHAGTVVARVQYAAGVQ